MSFLGGKCIAVRGSVFLQEDDHRTLQKTTISKGTAEVLKIYFQQIPFAIVADALAYLEGKLASTSTLAVKASSHGR